MARFIAYLTCAAFVMERWEFVAWGPWFWGTVIAANALNAGALILRRNFPRTWRALRTEAGMYRNVIERWLLERTVTRR